MLQKKQFAIAKWGQYDQLKWGYQYLPTKAKSPIAIFSHGLGFIGSDSISVEGLLKEGPLKLINEGLNHDFIYIGIQGASYPPEISNLKYILDNDPEIKEAWDGQNVLWTGLSAGGLRTLEAAALGMPGVFIPMSSPAFDANKIDGSKSYKAWVFHSDNDTQCPLANVAAAYQKLKPQKFTTPHDEHGGWTPYYDPNSKYGNVYDFAFGASQPPSIEKKIVLVYNFKSGKSFYTYDNDTYEVK